MSRYAIYALLALGLVMRTLMVSYYGLVDGGEVDVYLADEGIVGLMAKHIVEGRSLPVFFYGQAYLGALESYCAAALFAVAGVSLETLRTVPYLFSLALLVVVYRFTYRVYSVAAARWATAIVAVAPMYFLQWNLKARGGFIEHVVLLFTVMVFFWQFYVAHDRRPAIGFALGLTAGVAVWVNQLAVAYVLVLAALLLLVAPDRRGLAATAVGLLIGASLLIGYNVVHPLATVRTLARKSIVLNRVPYEERDEDWAARGVGKRVEALPQGAGKLGLVFGVPPAAELERLGLTAEQRAGGPLTPLRRALWWLPASVFGIALLACRPRRGADGWEPIGSNVLLGLFTVVTFIVGYVSPRYMLPAYPIAAVAAAVLVTRLPIARRRLFATGVGAVLCFNIASWVDAALLSAPASRERDAGERLLEHLAGLGIDRCYSAGPLYHLVFASRERVLFAPLQKNRIPAYDADVGRAQDICYVFREDQADKRQHLALIGALESSGVTYQSERVADYNILFSFTPRSAVTAEVIARARSGAGATTD